MEDSSRNGSQYRELIHFVNIIFTFILLLPIISLFYPLIMGDNFFQANSIKENLFTTFLYKLIFEFLPVTAISVWLLLNEPKRYSQIYALQKLNDLNPEISTKIRSLVNNYTKNNVDLFYYDGNRIDAFVSGTWNQLSLSLSKPSLDLDEKSLKALILHELSHIIHGDLWKTILARNATFVYMLIFVGGQILMLPASFQMYKSNYWFPAISTAISFIPVVIMWLGVYLMIRIGEKIADAFAVSEMRDSSNLANLFFLQSTIKTTGKASKKGGNRWGWLEYHPSIKERVASIKNQNSLLSEGNLLAIFSGLAASILIGATTDLSTEMIYMIPVLLLTGALIAFYTEKHTAILGYDGIRGLLRNISLILSFSTAASITFSLMTVSWLFPSTGNPLTSDPIPQVDIVFVSNLYLSHRLWVLTDLIIISSFFLPIVLVGLLGIKSAFAKILTLDLQSIILSNTTIWVWLSFLPFLIILCITWISFIKTFSIAWFLPWSILGSLFICPVCLISISKQSQRA